MKTVAIVCGVLLILSGPAAATTYLETFENGGNEAGWTYFSPNEQIEATGGNPGGWLHAWGLDTFAPQPATTQPSPFTGDLRAEGVTAIGVDLITIAVDFSAAERPLTLMLYSDNGTIGNPDDDWAAYFMNSEFIPVPGDGWKSFVFDVPSSATSLPPGWNTVGFGPGSPQNPDWNDVITRVDRLGFFYGDPTMFFIFQMWDVGMDNVSITYEAPTPAESVSWGRVKEMYR